MSKVSSALMMGALVVAAVALTRVPASAHFVPAPCDFITSGGFVFQDDGDRSNFGAHGGCKNDDFWGHVNYVDHGGDAGVTPYHVKSIEITGYLIDPNLPNCRDICGFAETNNPNEPQPVRFRVRLCDEGEPGRQDQFGIQTANGYLVTTRFLGEGGPGAGGNVQLHKPNPSNTGPDPLPDEGTMCGNVGTPGVPQEPPV